MTLSLFAGRRLGRAVRSNASRLAPLLWLLAALPGIAAAADPPTAAQLRIDPGEHTARIGRIATDAAGRWLATASHDKSVRLWDLGSGRLAATLRPPAGEGNEGKLFAVALTPDGATVAAGGWTGFAWDQSASIYLFDRASGHLTGRIGGLPNVVHHLAFSPDGRRLAAALGAGGIRLFDAASGRLLGEDRDYGKDSYGVDFSPDGRRLVATCYDGELRLYDITDGGLTLRARRAAPGGGRPYLARFSPDGRRIAVGFNDTPAVNVLDAATLALGFTPDTAGVNEDISSPAWSRDGAWLYAAGRAYDKDGQHFIRRWPVSSRGAGAARDWPVAGETLMDLAPLPGGRLAFASREPPWGVVDAAGTRVLDHRSVVANFAGLRQKLTLSADASRVGFGYAAGGTSPASFDAARRSLAAGTPEDLAAPRLAAPGIEVADWKYSTRPTLNGQPLALEEYEMSRSLALLPAAGGRPAGFVLGTDWYLRAFGPDGKPRWQQPVPGIAWAVNASADGRWVVAAYGDGTLRWHRAADGIEQLALYPHPDRKRWVLWSPSGYYDASPGAEDLIGWHVNRGKDQAAEFFPASRFRAKFYRPEVLAAVLQSGDEAQALAQADAEAGRRTPKPDIAAALPPVVRIVSPAEGERFAQSRLRLKYRVRTAGDAPVTAVTVLADGRPLPEARGLRPVVSAAPQDGELEYQLDLLLPPQDLSLAVLAENRHGTNYSQNVQLRWSGATDTDPLKPRLWVLAIGVGRYTHPDIPRLNYAAKDARDFVAALRRQHGRLYRQVEVRLLTEGEATRDEVVDGLEWLQRQVTQHDVGILFIGGHGVDDPALGYTFLPVNADPDRLKRTGVTRADVESTLRSIAGKALFFFDTCHAGGVLGQGRKGLGDDILGFVKELSSIENGVVVFSSSTGKQYSYEKDEWANGAFTKAVVEGLNGAAARPGNPRITHKMLDVYVSDRVKELTGGKQTPVTGTPVSGVPDFPIAVQ